MLGHVRRLWSLYLYASYGWFVNFLLFFYLQKKRITLLMQSCKIEPLKNPNINLAFVRWIMTSTIWPTLPWHKQRHHFWLHSKNVQPPTWTVTQHCNGKSICTQCTLWTRLAARFDSWKLFIAQTHVHIACMPCHWDCYAHARREIHLKRNIFGDTHWNPRLIKQRLMYCLLEYIGITKRLLSGLF